MFITQYILTQATGVSSKTREALSANYKSVVIPMARELESLNAAVAGSVILSEINRQQRTFKIQ